MQNVRTLKTLAQIMVIRPLLEASMAEIGDSAFRPSGELISYMERMTETGAGFVIVDSDIAPKGFIFMIINGSITTTDIWASCLFFYVRPEDRQAGLGTALIDFAKVLATGARATRMNFTAPKAIDATGSAARSKSWTDKGVVETETIFTIKV